MPRYWCTASVVVLAAVVEEVVFVLSKYSAYLLSREVIVSALQVVLARREFIVTPAVLEALDLYATHNKLGFVDCLLAVKGKGLQKNVLTFDTQLLKILS